MEIFGGAGRKSSHRLGFMSMQVKFSEREEGILWLVKVVGCIDEKRKRNSGF